MKTGVVLTDDESRLVYMTQKNASSVVLCGRRYTQENWRLKSINYATSSHDKPRH